MSWKIVDIPSEEKWSDYIKNFYKKHGFSYYKRPRFFVDESLGERAFKILQERGLNVKGVWSEGLCGNSDDQIVQFVRKDVRIILTHDDDFLDERIYPLKTCHGVIVIPYADKSHSEFENILIHCVGIINYESAGFIYQAKAKVTADDTWIMEFLKLDGKRVKKIMKNPQDYNRAFELISEATQKNSYL